MRKWDRMGNDTGKSEEEHGTERGKVRERTEKCTGKNKDMYEIMRKYSGKEGNDRERVRKNKVQIEEMYRKERKNAQERIRACMK